jgi:hypothetical protein
MPARRFPPPWAAEEQSACFVVRDHNAQQPAYVYFEDEPGRRLAAKLLTRDEAFRVVPYAPRRSGPRHAVVLRIGSTRAAAIPAHGGQALLKR